MRLSHEHHAADGDQQQGVILAALQAHTFEVIVSQGDGCQTTAQNQNVEEAGKGIQDHHAAEALQG